MALVTIGTQTWVVENLDVDVFGDGTPIMEVSASDQWERCGTNGTPAWCYYDFDSSNSAKYGRLYNWYVVSSSLTSRPIVENPQYKVATRTDYNTLASYLNGRATCGHSMKNTENWLTNRRVNGNGSNSSQWTGNPGGFVKTTGDFLDLGWSGNWWTQTSSSSDDAYVQKLYFANTSLADLSTSKKMGFSVRLIVSGSWTGSNNFNPSENWYG